MKIIITDFHVDGKEGIYGTNLEFFAIEYAIKVLNAELILIKKKE